jgi:hypothetical protein
LWLWQGSASLVAAFSHLPFHSRNARRYSWFCLLTAGIQGIALLISSSASLHLSPNEVFTILSLFSAIGLLGISWWLRKLAKRVSVLNTLKSNAYL